MTIERIYSCNTCNNRIVDKTQMFGLKFSDLKSFTLGDYNCTEGMHICYGCARQLSILFKDEKIKKQLEEEK